MGKNLNGRIFVAIAVVPTQLAVQCVLGVSLEVEQQGREPPLSPLCSAEGENLFSFCRA